MKEYLEIAAAVLNVIAQTEEWDRIQMEDPQVLKARAAFDRVLDRVKPYVTPEMLSELDDAASNYVASHIDAAILYGMHASEAIRYAAGEPLALSRHILARMKP